MEFPLKKKFVIKLKKLDSPPKFKDFVFEKIKSTIVGHYNQGECTQWSGYKKKFRLYSVACHIVHFKNGSKHYVDPQKYLYNYLHSPEADYRQLIGMKNRVRNIDACKNRGQCCCLEHLEEY